MWNFGLLRNENGVKRTPTHGKIFDVDFRTTHEFASFFQMPLSLLVRRMVTCCACRFTHHLTPWSDKTIKYIDPADIKGLVYGQSIQFFVVQKKEKLVSSRQKKKNLLGQLLDWVDLRTEISRFPRVTFLVPKIR
jgi:hypothetical protein